MVDHWALRARLIRCSHLEPRSSQTNFRTSKELDPLFLCPASCSSFLSDLSLTLCLHFSHLTSLSVPLSLIWRRKGGFVRNDQWTKKGSVPHGNKTCWSLTFPSDPTSANIPLAGIPKIAPRSSENVLRVPRRTIDHLSGEWWPVVERSIRNFESSLSATDCFFPAAYQSEKEWLPGRETIGQMYLTPYVSFFEPFRKTLTDLSGRPSPHRNSCNKTVFYGKQTHVVYSFSNTFNGTLSLSRGHVSNIRRRHFRGLHFTFSLSQKSILTFSRFLFLDGGLVCERILSGDMSFPYFLTALNFFSDSR